VQGVARVRRGSFGGHRLFREKQYCPRVAGRRFREKHCCLRVAHHFLSREAALHSYCAPLLLSDGSLPFIDEVLSLAGFVALVQPWRVSFNHEVLGLAGSPLSFIDEILSLAGSPLSFIDEGLGLAGSPLSFTRWRSKLAASATTDAESL
jgi:hypothetical protein